jgi:hypothetical protein
MWNGRNPKYSRQAANRVEMLFFNYQTDKPFSKKRRVKPLRIEIILSLSE